MADTGFKLPGTGEHDAGPNADWANATNIKADNESLSQVSSFGARAFTDFLEGYQFQFAIPAGSTIDGMEVQFGEYASFTGSSCTFNGVLIRTEDGSRGFTNRSDSSTWDFTEQTIEFGGASDLWGLTPSVSDVNDTDWGMSLNCFNTDFIFTSDARIDFFKMKIYYTAGSGGPTEPPLLHSFAIARAANY